MSKMATVTESKVNRPTRTEAAASNKTGAILEIDKLHVSFAGYPVLRDISLRIKRGQTLVVIGESGCGKTVLLKSIIRLIQPTEGAIRFESRDLATLNDRELTKLRTRFGFVFQQAALFDSLTIGQNVAFPLRQHRKLSDEEVEQNVRQALMDVGLPDSVVFKRPAEISGGMRKRVGLARALVMNPELILYDEPTTGLDPIMSDVINELILRTQRRTQVTSIVITHDMNTARKVGDRIVMIYPLTRLREDEPQILFDGSADELERCADRRVQQFVHGEAGERMMELERDNPLG